MRNASGAFMQALFSDDRAYIDRAVITLTDNTVLTLENDDIWENGLACDDAVSNENSFDIGAAIINQGKLVINNIYDNFSQYDFDGARVVLYTGLEINGAEEMLKMGTYVVDEPQYDGSVITLTCLDYMSYFDKPYTTTLVYPATLGEIVRDACTKCGVTLANSSQQFPHYDYEVETAPSGENTTYRQVISWAAQISGSFARCNVNGELELRWYDTAALDSLTEGLNGGIFDDGTPYYASGDNASGGVFNPWETGTEYNGGTFSDYSNVHIISSDYSCHLSTDDVVITGVRVRKKTENDSSDDAYEEYLSGATGYVVSIEENELIQGTHGQDIADWLGTALIGFRFRKAEITHPSDPTMEAGDLALFYDRKGAEYRIIISSTNFTSGSSQRTVSAAETPRKNSMQRFTEATKNYVELRKKLQKQQTAWEAAEEALSERIDNASGLFFTEVIDQSTGTTKTYYHDKADLADSDIVMLFSDVGFTITSNYQDATPTWYGMTVDGTFLASVIQTISLFFDYARGGTLVLGGQDNTNGLLRILDASGNQIGQWDKDGINLIKGSINLGNGAFIVTNAGVLTATSGSFSGQLSSPSGTIGNMVIKDDYICSNTSEWMQNSNFLTTLVPHSKDDDVYVGKGGITVGNGSAYNVKIQRDGLYFYNPTSNSIRIGSYNIIGDYHPFSMWAGSGAELQNRSNVIIDIPNDKKRKSGQQLSEAMFVVYFNTWISVMGVATFAQEVVIGGGTWMNGYIARVNGSLYVDGSVTQNSDERLKDIVPWDEHIDDFIQELEPIEYRWNAAERDKYIHFGLGAQRTLALLEKHGIHDSNLVMHNEEADAYGVTYQELAPMMLPSIQKNRKMIEALQKENRELRQQVSELTDLVGKVLDRLDAIEGVTNGNNTEIR